MPAKKRTKVSGKVQAKARQVLAFAEEQAAQVSDWVALHNALFGLGGKATTLFPTEAERTAFSRTSEYRRVLTLLDRLPPPDVKAFAELLTTANGRSASVCHAPCMPLCLPKRRRKASA